MRVAYFGTWGCKGHYVRAIEGAFAQQELDAFAKVDSPAYHEAMAADGYAYCLYNDFMGYCIPFSADDKRGGCITAIFVEGAKTSAEIREVLDSNPRLSFQFWKRRPKATDFPSHELSDEQPV